MTRFGFLNLRSIRTRVTLFTLAMFIISTWLLSFFIIKKMYASLEVELGNQQGSIASILASKINEGLDTRLNLMISMSEKLPEYDIQNPDSLQKFLNGQLAIRSYFNAGAFIVNNDGVAIASVPSEIGRVGVNYANREYITAALQQGKVSISKPVIGTVLMSPLFNITVPVKNNEGKIVGALVGVTDLAKPNFLDEHIQYKYGKSGYLLLADAKDNLVITGTDKRRILQPYYPPRHNKSSKTTDERSHSSTGITINPLGTKVLVTTRAIPAANWVIVTALPYEEAFAPIITLKKDILLIAAIITLLSALMSRWFLKRELAPMFSTVKTLAQLSKSGTFNAPLPVNTNNEIGELIASFNQLLAALGKKEAQLSMLLKTIPDLIWLKDVNGVFISCNSMFERFIGAKEHEIIGKTDYDFVSRELADFFRENDLKAIVAGKAVSNEEWLTFAEDGYRGLFETIKAPLLDQYGQLIGVFGIARDITARKNSELRLRLLSTAIEQSPTSVAITNLAPEIEYINPSFTKEAGYTVDEVIGKNPRILQSGLTDKSVYNEMWEKLTSGEHWSGEFINKRKNGEIYYEDAYISPVMDDTGKVTHYVAVKLDVTEKKQAQLALKKSNDRLEALLHSMAEGAYGMDLQGNCTFVNKSFLDILGYNSADEVIGRPIHTLIHHSHADGTAYPAADCKIYSAFKKNTEIHCVDEVFWHKNGHPIQVEYWSRPIFEDGVLTGAIATFVDISERKNMEEKIRQLALHDTLTGLPNRRLLQDRMDQAIIASKRNQRYNALMFMDLDNFKTLNDTHGHDAGDQLLKEVARRLRSCIREMDTVSRIGGDEFIVMIIKLDSDLETAKTHAAAVAEKIRDALAQPYVVKLHDKKTISSPKIEHLCSASIGIKIFKDDLLMNKDEIIKSADIAMYEAKSSGRDKVSFAE